MSNKDVDQLRLLSIFHYLLAGKAAIIALLPLGQFITFGVYLVSNQNPGNPPPAFFGWFFTIFALSMFTIGITTCICIALAGRRLGQRSGYMYCMVIAGIECLFMPFGTVLGVFTILVLQRPSVKAMFEGQKDLSSTSNPVAL